MQDQNKQWKARRRLDKRERWLLDANREVFRSERFQRLHFIPRLKKGPDDAEDSTGGRRFRFERAHSNRSELPFKCFGHFANDLFKSAIIYQRRGRKSFSVRCRWQIISERRPPLLPSRIATAAAAATLRLIFRAVEVLSLSDGARTPSPQQPQAIPLPTPPFSIGRGRFSAVRPRLKRSRIPPNADDRLPCRKCQNRQFVLFSRLHFNNVDINVVYIWFRKIR